MTDRYTKVAVALHWILALGILLHVAAALKHALFERDGIMRRMWL
jgi:cytochrome b561